jgi:hypothetical protein
LLPHGAEVVRVWRWLAAAVAWLLAVAIVAGVAWFAIASAGREVAGADDVVTLVDAAQPAPASATASSSAVPTPAPSSTPLGAVRPGPATRTGGDTPTQPGTGTPTGTPSVPGPSGGRTGTYSSAGGDLVVRCAGDEVTGWAMRPADGWRAEAAPCPGGELHVLFVAGDGRSVGVAAACPDGQPSFSPAGQSGRS